MKEPETPNWLKPLKGGTWLDQDSKSPTDPEKIQKKMARGGTWLDQDSKSPTDPEKIQKKMARARELSEVYRQTKVADILGVSRATVSRWLRSK